MFLTYYISKYSYAGVSTQSTENSGNDGVATLANFGGLPRIWFATGNTIYLVDATNNNIRKILPYGIIKAVSGNAGGFGENVITTTASMGSVFDVCGDATGNILYCYTRESDFLGG
jgi:hypothetical protein